MKFRKIILAGGSGSIGQKLAMYYSNLANEVIILSRTPQAAAGNIRTVIWDGRTLGDWADGLDNADMLINLCGKSVNCRYTARNRQAIIDSRVGPTQTLAEAINRLTAPPKLWINFASATIYRHAQNRPQDELTGDIGYGFSIDVCRQWEDAFFKADTPGVRKIALRTSIVLSKSGGAFPLLVRTTNLGLGGRAGHGQQMVSWVHEHDVARATEWLFEHGDIDGIVNCTAPNPLKNIEMMKALRNACGIPIGLPAPRWLLAMAAPIIGTEPELLLKGRWSQPARLTSSGFKFHYADFDSSVNDLLAIHA